MGHLTKLAVQRDMVFNVPVFHNASTADSHDVGGEIVDALAEAPHSIPAADEATRDTQMTRDPIARDDLLEHVHAAVRERFAKPALRLN